MIDPFTEKDNILMPIFMYYLDGVQQPPISLLRDTKISKYNSTLLQVNDLILTTNNNLELGIKRQEGFIMIIDCDQKYLLNGQSCASQEHINKFKQQTSYISFFTYISTFDTYEIKTSKVSYEEFMCLEFDRLFMMSVQLQPVRSQVNIGILFQNYLFYNYIESYKNFFQQQSLESIEKFFGVPIYIGYQLRLNPITINQEIRYQNIGEILAQTGSILSVLMMIKSLIQYYQNIILDNMIYYQVLNQWFPEQIKKNKYGMIKEIAGYKAEYQINKFKNLVDSKLDIIDIIYQIQRIQLLLIKKFGRGELQDANSFVIQPHAQLVTESVFGKEEEFYIEDVDILKQNFK